MAARYRTRSTGPVPAALQKRNPPIRKTKKHDELEAESIRLEDKLRDDLIAMRNQIEITLRLRGELEWQRIGAENVREQWAKPYTKQEYDEEVEKLEQKISQTWNEWKPAGGI